MLVSFLKEGLDFMIPLSHQRRVFEVSLALNFTLDSGIVDFADLLRIEPGPFLIIERPIERLYVFQFNEIDEGIADIAFVEEVYG